MKNLIYISGPITDNKTGQPREGWQEDFRAAEEKLRGMGFDVINPIEIADASEKQWKAERSKDVLGCIPEMPPRWYYLSDCIEHLTNILFTDTTIDWPTILGLYVIGDLSDISMSYGTMCEINFAMAAGLPVWSQYYDGYQMTNMLMQKCDGPTLAEAAEKLKDTKK